MGNDYGQKGSTTGVEFFVGSRIKLGGLTEEFKQTIFEGNKVSHYKQKKKNSRITGRYTRVLIRP